MEDRDDEAFLADLDSFLHEYDALQSCMELQNQERSVSLKKDVRHVEDSDKFLRETEVFLASYDPSATLVEQLTKSETVEINKVVSDKSREAKNAQAAKRRLKYRNKLKNERLQLQEQEQVLSEKLRQLQRDRKRVKSMQHTNSAMPLWKAIVSRQMDGRRIAEEQQRHLKKALTSRMKVLQEIDEVMRQKLSTVDSEKTTVLNTDELESDDIALFEEYLQDMDAVYKQTDEVFRAFGVEKNPTESYKVEPQWKQEEGMDLFENLDVRLIPSNFTETCCAMWRAICHVHGQNDRLHYRGIPDPENTIAIKCRIPSPKEAGGLVDMLIHVVTKRYVDDDRMIIVWRALTEGDDEFAGMHSDETGWCVVRRDKTDPLASTVVETFIRFVPMPVASTFGDKAHADQFAKLVVTSGEEDGVEIARLMQSLLIDDSNVIP